MEAQRERGMSRPRRTGRLTADKATPAYLVIARTIRESISAGRIAPGTILLEGPLSEIFGCSRSPVKQALALLAKEGRLSRFGGRGVVVGEAAGEQLHRIPIGPDDLGLESRTAQLDLMPGWQRVYQDVERDLVLYSAMATARINEVKLAAYYGVGRTVAHDVLRELHAVGILDKSRWGHWVIVPLDEQRRANLYELRRLLEPAMIVLAVDRVPAAILQRMRASLIAAIGAYPHMRAAEFDDLEHDLHVTCLHYAGNAEMLAALKRTRCILISGKHMLGQNVPLPPEEPFFAEHLDVIDALSRGDGKAAHAAMLAHLTAADLKVSQRLTWFRSHSPLMELPFLISERRQA